MGPELQPGGVRYDLKLPLTNMEGQGTGRKMGPGDYAGPLDFPTPV